MAAAATPERRSKKEAEDVILKGCGGDIPGEQGE